MKKCILVIDDSDQSDVLENLALDAEERGIELEYYQFNVGGRLEPTLLTAEGKIDTEKVKEVFKNRFRGKTFQLIACDWELNADDIDGVTLLRRIGRACYLEDTPRMMYSGLLNQKLLDALKRAKTGELKSDDFVQYIKNLVNSHYVDFVDRDDLSKTVLRHLEDDESLGLIILETLESMPEKVFATTHNHDLEGKTFGEVAEMFKKEERVRNDIKRNIVQEVIFFLTHKQGKHHI